MKLTKEEAIKKHRRLWNYIADETLKQARCVTIAEAFEHFGWSYTICRRSWCCEYDYEHDNNCTHCPIDWRMYEEDDALCDKIWRQNSNTPHRGLLLMWESCVRLDYCTLAYKYAKIIAELPERKD